MINNVKVTVLNPLVFKSSVDDDFKITRKELAVIHRERIKKELSIKNLEKDLQHYVSRW
jgi:hypothetical protein